LSTRELVVHRSSGQWLRCRLPGGTVGGVNPVLRSLVERHGGLVTRAAVLQVVPSWILAQARRDGHLLRVLPQVYVDARLVAPVGRPVGPSPEAARAALPLLTRLDRDLAARAALAYADGQGALSHLTALHAWGLHRQAVGDPVHLSVPAGVGIRTRPYLLLHQRSSFAMRPPHVVHRKGLLLTRLEPTLVDAWPLLPPTDRPGPLIQAVNDRLTTPYRVGTTLAGAPRLTGRAELRALLDRLVAGCRSPLEIWGHDRVFIGPGMPPFLRQARMQVGGRVMYLDMYAERERVDIELDGAATHGDPQQRVAAKVDLALLATLGILVVRFSHRRLVCEPDQVRRETLAILAHR
jgi:hypothetical protein